ncbi:MAG: hypothetical protein HY689_11210 [Chloroflexi bacterium]|nr:hypothetical protein [Chloroflexota bacterium]
MICGRCGLWCSVGDNYCRRCGAALATNLPAVPAEQRLARLPQAVPPAVWKGVAALAAGKALEWGIRAAARRLLRAAPAVPSPLLWRRRPTAGPTLPLPRDAGATATGGAVAEMVVWFRHIRIIRGPGGDGQDR